MSLAINNAGNDGRRAACRRQRGWNICFKFVQFPSFGISSTAEENVRGVLEKVWFRGSEAGR